MSESHLSKIKIRGTGREVTYKLNDDEARAYISALEQRVLALENIIYEMNNEVISAMRTANDAQAYVTRVSDNLEKRMIQLVCPDGVIVWARRGDGVPFNFGEWFTTSGLADDLVPYEKIGDGYTEVTTVPAMGGS